MHQEDHFYSNHHLLNVASVLLGKFDPRHDRPTNLESNEQTRSSRPNDTMGSQAKPIQH